MSAPLPLAKVHWHYPMSGSRTCEVIVDGKPVAVLPARSFAYSVEDPSSLPLVTFTLAAGDVHIETYNPARSTT